MRWEKKNEIVPSSIKFGIVIKVVIRRRTNDHSFHVNVCNHSPESNTRARYYRIFRYRRIITNVVLRAFYVFVYFEFRTKAKKNRVSLGSSICV